MTDDRSGSSPISVDPSPRKSHDDDDDEVHLDPASARLGKRLGIGFGLVVGLFFAGMAVQAIGNLYIGWGVILVRLMQLPMMLGLLLLLLLMSVGSLVFGVASLVRPSLRPSWGLTLFCLVEGGALTLVLFTFVLPMGVMAPVRDIPYLVRPVEGTVYAAGLGEETTTDSEGYDHTSYYVYLVPDDLPGIAGGRVFRVEVGSANYDAWMDDLGLVDPGMSYGYRYDGDTSDMPVYRVTMLPNTETLISFEPVG